MEGFQPGNRNAAVMQIAERMLADAAKQRAVVAKQFQPPTEQMVRTLPPCDHTALEAKIARLQKENQKLHAATRTLHSTLLGYTLEADLQQDIDSPGDWDDYWFSEN